MKGIFFLEELHFLFDPKICSSECKGSPKSGQDFVLKMKIEGDIRQARIQQPHSATANDD